MKSFIHTADNHLRDSQYGRRTRGDDFAAAFTAVLEKAHELGETTILCAGDLLDSTRPSPKIIAYLKHIDQKACEYGIQILVISGNHDLTEPHWASIVGFGNEARPCGLRIIDNQLVTLPSGLTVYGQPYVPKDTFLAIKDSLPPADVLMFHGMVQELMHFKSESALTLAELPTDKYRFIALGDIHVRKYVAVGGCMVGYPGSTEMCESSEALEKTVSQVTIPPDASSAIGSVEPVRIPTRKAFRFKLVTEPDLEAALDAVEKAKDSDPLVFVYYMPTLGNVPARFLSRIDPTKALFRFYPISADLEVAMPQASTELITPKDLLGNFIPAGNELYQLAADLLDPGVLPNDRIDLWLNQKKAALVTP